MSADGPSSSRKRPHPGPDGPRPAYPRKRAAQACTTCRKRRVKCDNERPSCTGCAGLGVQCVYRESDKSSFDAASITILDRLDDLETLFRAAVPENASVPPQRPVDPQPPPDTTPRSPDFALSAGPVFGEVYRVNVEAVLDWPAIAPAAHAQPRSLAAIYQPGRRHPEGEGTGPRLLSTSDLDAETSRSLLQSFMQNFHVYNPVLEIAEVEDHVKFTLYNGPGWDARSCISLIVFALGTLADGDDAMSSTSATFRQSRRFRDAEAFFSAAQRRMGPVLCSSGLTEAQICFLAGVYLMATMRPLEAWRMFVQALACCQVLESSADPPQDGGAQLQRSIYWTSFKSELELRLELSITENSAWNLRYPQFFPAPPRGLQSEGEPSWYYYLAEIALRRLGNRILAHTSHFKSADTAISEKVSRIQDFEQQAESWVASLPSDFRFHKPLGVEEPPSRLGFILNGHLVDCYEMMYWPFIVDAVCGGPPDDADLALLARKGFQVSARRIEDNEAGFRHRHHGTWLMLRSCTRSALVLMAAARAGLQGMLPDGWRSSARKVVGMLRYWRDEVPDAACRLELLESLMESV